MARIGDGFNIKSLRKKIEDEWIKEMRKDCVRLVRKAYETKTYDEDTGNLADSYGAAVYKDGVLIKDTLAFRNQRATEAKEWEDGDWRSGHEEMLRYFQNYRPRAKGLTLVLVAAMPYAEVLESGKAKNGTFTLKKKYKVITGAYGELKNLKAKYENEATKLGYKRAKYGQGIRVTLNVYQES